MSWFISDRGKVLSYDRRGDIVPLDCSPYGFENLFDDKERCYYFRDKLEEEHPNVFRVLPLVSSGDRSGKYKRVTEKGERKFRDDIKLSLMEKIGEFWADWSQLKPRDKCDIFLKMMRYGFPMVPDEAPLDEEGKAKLILEETRRKAMLIAGKKVDELDTDFEDVEPDE